MNKMDMKKLLFILLLYSQYGFSQQYETLIKVSKEGKHGYLDENGKERIPCIFEEIGYFNEGLVVAQKDGHCYYYNAKGEVVLDLGRRYGDCGSFSDSLALVMGDSSMTFNDIVHFKNGFDLRYIDRTGKEVLRLNEELRIWTDFPSTLRFHDGMLGLQGYPGLDYTSARVYTGYLNKAGELQIPFLFHSHYDNSQRFSEGLAGASIHKYNNMQKSNHAYGEGGFGYIDKKGKWVIPPRYHYIQPFHCGAARVTMSYGQGSRFYSLRGSEDFYINKKGHRIFEDTIFAGAQMQKDSIVGIYREHPERRYALAKTTGEFITDFEFENMYRGDLWAVEKSGKLGFIDDEGNVVIPYQYAFNNPYSHGFEGGVTIIGVKEREQLYAVINEKNEILIPPIPDAKYNNYHGIICQYFAPYHKYRNKAKVYFNNKGERINLEGYKLESDPYRGRFQRVLVE